jgi:Papain family cysteine protease
VVLDQGQCQSCVTYAAYVAFRGVARKHRGDASYELPLTLTQIWEGLNGECDQTQLPSEVFRRTAELLNAADPNLQWETIPHGVTTAQNKKYLLENGPTFAIIRIPVVSQMEPDSRGPDGGAAHAVAVVGFVTGVLADEWILQNSWGPDWQNNGRMTIGSNSHDINDFQFWQPRLKVRGK